MACGPEALAWFGAPSADDPSAMDGDASLEEASVPAWMQPGRLEEHAVGEGSSSTGYATAATQPPSAATVTAPIVDFGGVSQEPPCISLAPALLQHRV
eukprot:CAMPEP_0174868532 /NCGR_PEP_ID=MMETSP1114-20130205/66164_1 /TAXON_ID=312471 /ORGANISM="Neobodo designis, Strain CCAP 1951/1" /LENGTH=97 /DNA_ID=CAMNT_0016103751 /DNA_START=72 /DNA_END=361 /DNA_ORIENTATION=+